jgi:hypothetical protein
MAKARHEKSPEIVAPMVDPFVAGGFPIDLLITFYDFIAINHAAADAVDGAALSPALRMP